MNILRCKTLLRLTYVFPKNEQFYYDIKLRDYCTKILTSSEAIAFKSRTRTVNKHITKIKTEHKNEETIFDLTKSTVNTKLNIKKPLNLNSQKLQSEHLNTSKNYDHVDRKVTSIVPCEDEIIYSNLKNQNNVSEDKIITTNEENMSYILPNDEFNSNEFIKKFNKIMPQPLDKCTEDLSDFGRGLSPTFNFAAYANKSKLIQTFIKLGVQLYKVEKNEDHMKTLLSVNLENELPLYLRFFHDCGVPADNLGEIITINPMILKEDLDDMETRIRYLKAHKFTEESISRIITKNPSWLLWTVKNIDERLGHFQNEFKLSGSEVRFLATKQPKLITYVMKSIHENTFAIREEMGFNGDEIKTLLLAKPRLWINSRKKIVETYIYVHNVMNLSNTAIISNADILTCRASRLKSRHEFLLELNKVQYDPKEPGYICPSQIAFKSDVEFCKDIAKTPVETYNLFLRTL